MLDELIHKLYILISKLDLRNIMIINQILINNNNDFLDDYTLLINYLKVNTLNININYN